MIKFTDFNCIKCNYPLYGKVYDYSKTHIGFALCQNCQDWFREKNNKPTKETKMLYLALKERNIPVEIEKYDGFKSIDLAIPNMKFNIEVDGSHHNLDLKQATSDILRTFHSLEKGYFTLRIPNILIKQKLNETADCITRIILDQKEKQMDDNLKEDDDIQIRLIFEKMVFNFIVYFFTVFESDWEYTSLYISQEGSNYENLLDEFPNDANWQNRDLMVKAYYDLIEFVTKNKIFKKIVK